MLFSLPVAVALAMASSAFAQTQRFNPIDHPKAGQVVVAGSVMPIEWMAPPEFSKPEDKVCLVLMAGETNLTLTDKKPISCGIQSSANVFRWNVGAELGNEKVYGIRMELESDKQVFQYSYAFAIQGTNSPTTSANKDPAPKTLVIESISPAENKTTTNTAIVATTSAHVKPTNSALGVAVDNNTVDCGDKAAFRTSSPTTLKTFSPSNSTASSNIGTVALGPVTGAGSVFSAGLISLVGGMVAAFVL